MLNDLSINTDHKLLQLRSVKYRYIDITKNFDATKKVYGFLAEEVKSVFPEAVNDKNSELIPNIYLMASVEEDILTIAKDLSIQYVKNRFDATSGFFYVGLHGYLYPLIYSLENIYTAFFSKPTDFLFRGLNNFYSLFVLLLAGTYFKNKSLKLTLIVILTIIFNYSFFFTALQTSIDHLRIYLLLVFILLWQENLNEARFEFAILLPSISITFCFNFRDIFLQFIIFSLKYL